MKREQIAVFIVTFVVILACWPRPPHLSCSITQTCSFFLSFLLSTSFSLTGAGLNVKALWVL